MAQSNPLLTSNSHDHLSTLLFDPGGERMYVEANGRLYEWKLGVREGPEWWFGEE